MADLELLNPSNVAQVSEDTIHPGFIAELRSRRLTRKRKMMRYVLSLDSSTDEDKTIASSHIVFPTDSSDTNGGGLTPKNNILNEEEVQVGAGQFNEIASSLDGNDDSPQQGYDKQNGSQQANSPIEVEQPPLGNAHNIGPVKVEPPNVPNDDSICPVQVEPPNFW